MPDGLILPKLDDKVLELYMPSNSHVVGWESDRCLEIPNFLPIKLLKVSRPLFHHLIRKTDLDMRVIEAKYGFVIKGCQT